MAPETSIIVPMLLDAYINPPPPRTINIVGANATSQPTAYLAPIPQPKFSASTSATFTSGTTNPAAPLLHHDIFEDISALPYFRGSAAPERRTWDRAGIYLSWRLPPHYRTGMAASGESADFTQKLKEGGYYDADAPGTAAENGTRFRQVPNRWVVCRTVTPLTQNGNNNIMVAFEVDPNNPPTNVMNGSQVPWQETIYANNEAYGTKEIRTLFMVESDTVRQINSIDELEDTEITASPFIDENLSVTQQSQSFLGNVVPLESFNDFNPQLKNPTTVTVARSSNPYFADFQPQNSSVFSFFDNLNTSMLYTTSPNSAERKTFKITAGNISYTVIGYHRDFKAADPLGMPLVPGQSANDRLAALRLGLSTKSVNTDIQNALQTVQAAPTTNGGPLPDPPIQLHTVCSGTFASILYSVSDYQHIPRMIIPGDDIQSSFVMTHPLSVGTNPIDALFGWLRAQPSGGTDPKSQLLRLQSFILNTNDDLDSQLQAEDLLATNNFLGQTGGTTWHIQPPPPDPNNPNKTVPLPPNVWDYMSILNASQKQLDALVRERQILQTQMFYLWWKYAADLGKDTNASLEASVIVLKNLRNSIHLNDGMQQKLTRLISQTQKNLNKFELKSIVEPRFYTQADPTLMIAGAKSKFAISTGQPLPVRIQGQETVSGDESENEGNYNHEFTNMGDQKAFTEIKNVDDERYSGYRLSPLVWSLVCEASRLHGGNPQSSLVNPEYKGKGDTFQNENGWFPLFIEWEIEYFHIPFESWDFGPCGLESRFGYRIKKGVNLADGGQGATADYRVIKGRSPILPQTSGTLQSTLKQVFAKVNPDQLATALNGVTMDSLLAATQDMDYLSTPMLGMTAQLTTVMDEAHFVPVTFPDGNMKVADEAKSSVSQLGLGQNDLTEMANGMSTTPFASLMDLPADINKYSPFKPVTHGQFRFTKFNIIDKFGQVVAGIDKIINAQGQLTYSSLFPCLGEAYSLETRSDNSSIANAVMKRSDSWCPFVQVPPCINQPARVNASFVKRYTSSVISHPWRQVEEWENPILGWIVINFANVSLQIFTSDGRFVREYSVLNDQVAKLPFPADNTAAADLDPLMVQLLAKFDDTQGYMTTFFKSISTTVQAVQSNPSHYAESMLSILGRPLALTTFGVSMELASPPLADQSTFKNSRINPNNPLPNSDPKVTDYNFTLKIGDGDNVFDGLYLLFNENLTIPPPPKAGTQPASFDLSKFYSYHNPDMNLQPPLIKTQPFYLSPSTYDQPSPPNQNQNQNSYNWNVDAKMQVFASIVDPFTPVHVYSALLPITQLQLPSWAVDQGISRLASFFKKGPTVLATDVPNFHPNTPTNLYVVDKDIPLTATPQPTLTGSVAIPAVSVGDWNWLQPYKVDAQGTVKYNELGVEQPEPDGRMRLDTNAPYTVTEGYLTMKRPFTAPDPTTRQADLVFGPGPVIPPS